MAPYFEVSRIQTDGEDMRGDRIITSRKLEDGEHVLYTGGEHEVWVPFSVDGRKITVNIERAEGSLERVHLYAEADDDSLSEMKRRGITSITFETRGGESAIFAIEGVGIESRGIEYYTVGKEPKCV